MSLRRYIKYSSIIIIKTGSLVSHLVFFDNRQGGHNNHGHCHTEICRHHSDVTAQLGKGKDNGGHEGAGSSVVNGRGGVAGGLHQRSGEGGHEDVRQRYHAGHQGHGGPHFGAVLTCPRLGLEETIHI